jgi:hypothetical protein
MSAPLQVSANVTIIPGYTPRDLSFTLMRGGVISGRLRDPNGRLIPSMTIAAYQIVYRDGRGVLTNVKSAQTDDRGEYRLFWMAPGNYLISAIPRRPAAIPAPQDVYARTFYPGLLDPRVVPPVVVTDGSDIPSIDIMIRPEAIAKITGRVVGPSAGLNEKPAAVTAGTMYLMPRDPNALADSAIPTVQNVAINRANGRFEIRNVLPGSYDLVASMTDSPGGTMWGRARVDVGSIDIDDIVVDVRGFEIKANITIDGEKIPKPDPLGAPAPAPGTAPTLDVPARPPFELQLHSRETYNILDEAANAKMAVDAASGTYVFPSVPEGRYRFQVSPLPDNAYVEDIREGSVSVFDEGLAVLGVPAGDITILINTKGATVKGNVTGSDLNPVDEALVALVPAQARRANLLLYRTTRSDEKGQFTINGVAPGEYRMFAWENVPTNAWLNADFMALQESRGKSLMVTAGGSASADLKVIPREIR